MSTQQGLIYLPVADRRQWDYVIQTLCIRAAAIQLHKADRATHAHGHSDSCTSVGWRARAQEACGRRAFIYAVSAAAFHPVKRAVKRRRLSDLYSLMSSVQLESGECLPVLETFLEKNLEIQLCALSCSGKRRRDKATTITGVYRAILVP